MACTSLSFQNYMSYAPKQWASSGLILLVLNISKNVIFVVFGIFNNFCSFTLCFALYFQISATLGFIIMYTSQLSAFHISLKYMLIWIVLGQVQDLMIFTLFLSLKWGVIVIIRLVLRDSCPVQLSDSWSIWLGAFLINCRNLGIYLTRSIFVSPILNWH